MRHNFLCFVLQLPASVMMCVRRMETAAQTDVQVRVIVIVMSCIINLYITGICYCTDDCESRLYNCCYYCSYSESIYQNNTAFYHACRGRASSDSQCMISVIVFLMYMYMQVNVSVTTDAVRWVIAAISALVSTTQYIQI